MKEIRSDLIRRIINNDGLSISIGLVYLWFGVLKFFPGISPAESIAKETINQLTFGFIPSNISINLLAIWESGIGLLLIANFFKRTVIIITSIHLVFTFTPLFLFPEPVFNNVPFLPTMLGQYILKNIIIAGALITLFKKK